MADENNEQKSQEAAQEEQVTYKTATEKNFKFGKSYLVKDPINGNISEYVPKEGTGLAQQAVKYAGFVARNQVVIKEETK